MRLTNRVAVVTGAGGIGKEIARTFGRAPRGVRGGHEQDGTNDRESLRNLIFRFE
jgi:NAD(P)-dependent dehydrogenase (short-subunit alcohol dehydrogenase family)